MWENLLLLLLYCILVIPNNCNTGFPDKIFWENESNKSNISDSQNRNCINNMNDHFSHKEVPSLSQDSGVSKSVY